MRWIRLHDRQSPHNTYFGSLFPHSRYPLRLWHYSWNYRVHSRSVNGCSSCFTDKEFCPIVPYVPIENENLSWENIQCIYISIHSSFDMSRTCRSNSSSPNPDTSPGFRSVDGTREAYGNTLKNARPETIVVSRDRIARENQAWEEKEKEMKRK